MGEPLRDSPLWDIPRPATHGDNALLSRSPAHDLLGRAMPFGVRSKYMMTFSPSVQPRIDSMAASSSKQATIAFWLGNYQDVSSSSRAVLHIDNGLYIWFEVAGGSTVKLHVQDEAGTILDMYTASFTPPSGGTLQHFEIRIDMTDAIATKILRDGSPVSVTKATFVNSAIGFAGLTKIGSSPLYTLKADIYDFYLDNQLAAANSFYDNNGTPHPRFFGYNGEKPTKHKPLIYINGYEPRIGNRGRGGKLNYNSMPQPAKGAVIPLKG